MPESMKIYRKFPTRNFLSFYLEEELIPKLLFRVCLLVLFSFLASESLVPLISLDKLVDLRSKANWIGLTAQLFCSSALSSKRGDYLRDYLIFRMP